jgi:hypothetical protein
MTFQPYTTTFHQEAKEVMRITANSVTVTPGVSVDEAAAAVIAALEQHMRNIVAAEREACAKVAESMRPNGGRMFDEAQGACFSALTDCVAAIRARGEK